MKQMDEEPKHRQPTTKCCVEIDTRSTQLNISGVVLYGFFYSYAAIQAFSQKVQQDDKVIILIMFCG